MTLQEAQASGLLGPLVEDYPSDCQQYQALKGVEYVYVDKATHRVVAINLGPALRTDKGIGSGDTYREVHEKYPDVKDAFNGAATAKAPKAPVQAHYTFTLLGTSEMEHLYPEDRVADISLETDDHRCYN